VWRPRKTFRVSADGIQGLTLSSDFILESSLYFASFVAILSSVVSSFFYIRLVKTMYFEKKEEDTSGIPVNHSCSLVMAFCSFFLVYFL
jgi:NADH-quinone oxidoreductase subunit N